MYTAQRYVSGITQSGHHWDSQTARDLGAELLLKGHTATATDFGEF